MKIVSVVFFTGALIGSWYLMRAHSPISEAMHMDIQNDLKQIITEYVEKSLPQSKNLRFEKFWTEAVKPTKVKAFFAYSFEDQSEENGATLMRIEGSAVLNKIEQTEETVTWSLDELKIQDNQVDFQEPIHITAGTSGDGVKSPAETH